MYKKEVVSQLYLKTREVTTLHVSKIFTVVFDRWSKKVIAFKLISII